ncbi:hypothetical protein ACHAQA_000242 [Verticillium albo-atrum]
MPSTATIYLVYSSPPNTLCLRTIPLPLPQTPTPSREAFLAALRTATDLPITDRNVTLYWTHPHGAIRIAGGRSQTTTLLHTTVPVTTPVAYHYPTWSLSAHQLCTPWTAISPFGPSFLGSTVQNILVPQPAVGLGFGYTTSTMPASVPATTYRCEPFRLDVSALVNMVDFKDVTEAQWPGYLGFAGANLRLCIVVDVEGARAEGRVVASGDDGVDGGGGSPALDSAVQDEHSARDDAPAAGDHQG